MLSLNALNNKVHHIFKYLLFIQYLYFSFKVSVFGTSKPKRLGYNMLYLNETVNLLAETFWAWKMGE